MPSSAAPTLNTDEQITAFVKKVHDEVVQRHDEEKEEALREALKESRDAVMAAAVPPPPRYFSRPLPSSGTTTTTVSLLLCQPCQEQSDSNNDRLDDASEEEQTEQEADIAMPDTLMPETSANTMNARPLLVSVTFQNSRGKRWNTTRPAVPLEGAHEPRPTGATAVFLKSHFATEDEKELSFVPYFGDDDDHQKDVLDLYTTKGRERMVEFGPEYRERETRRVIQDTMELVEEKIGTTPNVALQERLKNALSTLLKVDIDRIQNLSDEFATESPKKSNPDLDYSGAVDSYRVGFCRRCFTYDCNLHGMHEKPDLDIQAKLGIEKERSGLWKEDDIAEEGKATNATVRESNKRPLKDAVAQLYDEFPDMTELTPLQKAMCERTFIIHQGDYDKIAITLGAPRNLVIDYIKSEGMNLDDFEDIRPDTQGEAKKRKADKRKADKSMRRYNASWLKRVEDAEIHPFFAPCSHEGACSEENCSCVKNRFFCTKHCVWGEKSRNFFRGCNCSSACGTKGCPCFASNRECDPDLCSNCGTCSDPPGRPATNQKCRNDSLSMRRNRQCLVAKSTVEAAGWGLYTKYALKKGDFINEYVGEVISQQEAERRGVIYDRINRSYLFNLCSDLCVDASRKGNKMRFMNHSDKPNCEVRMTFVNGDTRIGFFASCDIDAQTELFFDYRYNVSMDNELIVKSGIVADWMNDPKMASKVSKKNAAKS